MVVVRVSPGIAIPQWNGILKLRFQYVDEDNAATWWK